MGAVSRQNGIISFPAAARRSERAAMARSSGRSSNVLGNGKLSTSVNDIFSATFLRTIKSIQIALATASHSISSRLSSLLKRIVGTLSPHIVKGGIREQTKER